ncbi:MAG: polysaccharide deacetylase family protein [Firmicutes bacterium]|nr:polysaccharide deacetylase family protein [[Eubacterium] siraeum]MCM1487639.1 polysaccharide deacetylase family protein [Bacillota bacterium]
MKRLKIVFLLIAALTLTACQGSTDEEAGTAANDEAAAQTEQTEETVETEEAVKEVKPIVYDIDPTKPVIALTFDDGPNTTTTNEVLDVLEKYQVKASFFLIGNNINEESAKAVKRAYDLGCEIDNHSKSHSYMNQMEADEIKEETDFVTEKVREITGEPTKFFRPPYIAVNKTMYDNIDMPFICGIGCDDWNQNVTVDLRVVGIEGQIEDGAIILLHDVEGNSQTVEAIDRIIPDLLEEGYQFATVSELFEAKGIEISADDSNLYTIVG